MADKASEKAKDKDKAAKAASEKAGDKAGDKDKRAAGKASEASAAGKASEASAASKGAEAAPAASQGAAPGARLVAAAISDVGKVRDHNEDSFSCDADRGLFIVCDGMGGHAAGEVASALAVKTVRERWLSEEIEAAVAAFTAAAEPDAQKRLMTAMRTGAAAAHDAILAEAARDGEKHGMGTTLVAMRAIGGYAVFAHAGDSRAYMVRDKISMQLTEDHTLLARLLAAGIDVDTSGDGARFRSMLTNALGIGTECRVATFLMQLLDGDQFLLCSDGVSEYVGEAEIGEVLVAHPEPEQAARKLVQLALDRGGSDNATALVVRVEAAPKGASPDRHKEDQEAVAACPLFAKLSPQQRLRALRIAIGREYGAGERLPAQTLGGRVAWVILEGELDRAGARVGKGALLYAESLVDDRMIEREQLAVAAKDVRAMALRADDFRELCEDDAELGEALLEALSSLTNTAGRHRTK
jgi:serine/threonine protein phosphatase PrpC